MLTPQERRLQISHFVEPSPERGFVVETWFNPPVAQALTLPGWFDDHFENMRRYNRLAAVGVLVGTESNGSVKKGLIAPGEAWFAAPMIAGNQRQATTTEKTREAAM